jgi:hypothetical protein
VVTLPPLIFLLLAGPIAAAKAAGAMPGRAAARRAIGAPLVLLVLVAAINLWTAILPWYRYGEMKDALAAKASAAFRPDDLFVSSESGIDPVLVLSGEHVRVKEVFRHSPKQEGFARIRAAIAERLAAGARVFVYNFVPSPFTLLGLNQVAARQREGPLSARDFEDFLQELGRAHTLVPVLPYWEESKEPLYLFGRRREWIWQLTRARSARAPP